MKKRRISNGLWEIDGMLMVAFSPPKTRKETGHSRTLGMWKDMQNKMVGYTLSECLKVAANRRAQGLWPFPKPRRIR
jgi:hypothetical protein